MLKWWPIILIMVATFWDEVVGLFQQLSFTAVIQCLLSKMPMVDLTGLAKSAINQLEMVGSVLANIESAIKTLLKCVGCSENFYLLCGFFWIAATFGVYLLVKWKKSPDPPAEPCSFSRREKRARAKHDAIIARRDKKQAQEPRPRRHPYPHRTRAYRHPLSHSRFRTPVLRSWETHKRATNPKWGSKIKRAALYHEPTWKRNKYWRNAPGIRREEAKPRPKWKKWMDKELGSNHIYNSFCDWSEKNDRKWNWKMKPKPEKARMNADLKAGRADSDLNWRSDVNRNPSPQWIPKTRQKRRYTRSCSGPDMKEVLEPVTFNGPFSVGYHSKWVPAAEASRAYRRRPMAPCRPCSNQCPHSANCTTSKPVQGNANPQREPSTKPRKVWYMSSNGKAHEAPAKSRAKPRNVWYMSPNGKAHEAPSNGKGIDYQQHRKYRRFLDDINLLRVETPTVEVFWREDWK